MIPTSVPIHVVRTVFQYILPPNLPLPPHLVSRQLSERHHFLSITPTDTVSYLCWPSPDAHEVISSLETTDQDDWAVEHQYIIYYTAPDHQTLLAHIRPNGVSPVQIVFCWDLDTESWKYHDARLLPFPPSSYPTLQMALDNAQSSHSRSSSPPCPEDFWVGYDSDGDSPERPSLTTTGTDEDDKAEAAYWASYSVVQGSGDSTVPSPRKQTRPDYALKQRSDETNFDPLIANLHLRLQRDNGFLDAQYSASERSFSPPAPPGVRRVGEDDVDCPNLSELKMLGGEDGWVCTINGCMKGKSEKALSQDNTDNQADTGLRDAIRGLYGMWTASSGRNDKDAFTKLVKDALG